MGAKEIVLCVGDILYDDTLQDVAILLERFDTVDNPERGEVSDVPVWRVWWIHSGEELWSEFGLQNIVAMGVFTRYTISKD